MDKELGKGGRPREYLEQYDEIIDLRSTGMTYRDIAAAIGVPKSVCWDIINIYEAGGPPVDSTKEG